MKTICFTDDKDRKNSQQDVSVNKWGHFTNVTLQEVKNILFFLKGFDIPDFMF